MFTVLSHMHNKLAPQPFQQKMQQLLRYYQAHDQGQWMRSMAIAKLRFCFNLDMSVQNGIMGAWSTFDKNNVQLMPTQQILQMMRKPELSADDIQILHSWAYLIAPTAIHQIRHRWQRASYGPFKYLLCSIPIIREWTIQADADEITTQAQRLMEAKQHMDDARLFASRHLSDNKNIPS